MTRFFQNCWSFIQDDLWKLFKDFCKTKRFFKNLNNSVIPLIPKKPKCYSFNDYIPILLCNTIYKVVAKFLVNRLKLVLGKIISIEHNGFVPGWEIIDNILCINEAIHTLKSSRKVGMIIKLDVSKAYDKVR